MCIILGPVITVKNTRIFACPYDDRQITVYSNEVSAENKTLMILPVPYPDSIEFHKEIMQSRSFFDKCQKSFRSNWSMLRETTASLSGHETRSFVPVIRVGSYMVSIAKSLEDLDNLDPSVFVLEDKLRKLLVQSYKQPFGFICCRMGPGSNTYQPLAYSHRRLYDSSIFIPTKHYHTHEGSKDPVGSADWDRDGKAIKENPVSPADWDRDGKAIKENPVSPADWDHEIYTVFTRDYEAHTDGSLTPIVPNHLNADLFPSSTDPFFKVLLATQPMRKWVKKGDHPNIDLKFYIEKDSKQRFILNKLKEIILHKS